MSNEGDISLSNLCATYVGTVVVSLYGSKEITEGVIENRPYNNIDTWWVGDVLFAIADERGVPVAVPALRYLVPVGYVIAA